MSNPIKNTKQAGFSLLETILVIAVIALIIFLGWTFYQNAQKQAPKEEGTMSILEDANAPAVETSNDLQEAEDYIKATDVDKQLDTSEIDAALNE